MRALDRPMDRFLDHGLWLTARDLQPHWLAALKAGQFDCGGDVKHLTFLLQSAGSPGVVEPLMTLLVEGKLPPERQESVLVLVAALGGPKELRTVFDMAMDAKTPGSVRAELLAALVRAARMRKVRPEGELSPIGTLLDDNEEPLRIAAIEAAGLWQVPELADRLIARATAAETSDGERRAALEALAAMGPQSTAAVLALCKADHAAPLRADAICALATLDVQSAAAELVSLLRQESTFDPAAVVVALLDRKGGSAALAAALDGQRLPTDAAKLAVRAVRSVAREEPALVAALSSAGGIAGGNRTLGSAEIADLVRDVGSQGSAERGEAVFRRAEQQCLKCHAIAGAGGRVGPDLVSIGASAKSTT